MKITREINGRVYDFELTPDEVHDTVLETVKDDVRGNLLNLIECYVPESELESIVSELADLFMFSDSVLDNEWETLNEYAEKLKEKYYLKEE